MLSLTWGWLRVLSHSASQDWTELVMVAPIPQPVAPEEPEDLTPPPVMTEEPTSVPAVPPLPNVPVTPLKPEPTTPPKMIAQPVPKQVEPRPKPIPPSKPTRVKKPPAEIANEAMPGPRDAPIKGDAEDFTPGPHLPMPDASRDSPAGKVLGPSPTQQVENRPLAPVEGGEAGAGNLFERGDAGVIPGAGVGGGSGARGRGGLGLGDSGGGARVGGVQPGPGGEGPVKAAAQAACQLVAIKSNRVIRIQPGAGASKARSWSRPMSLSRDAWNRYKLSNRLDMRISMRRRSRPWGVGASSLPAGVDSRSRCGCRFP